MSEPFVPNRFNAGTTKEHINKLKLNYEKMKQLKSFDKEAKINEQDEKYIDPNMIRHFNFDVTI
jgi:hypothetical protein